jgi:hypothetical protein
MTDGDSTREELQSGGAIVASANARAIFDGASGIVLPGVGVDVHLSSGVALQLRVNSIGSVTLAEGGVKVFLLESGSSPYAGLRCALAVVEILRSVAYVPAVDAGVGIEINGESGWLFSLEGGAVAFPHLGIVAVSSTAGVGYRF